MRSRRVRDEFVRSVMGGDSCSKMLGVGFLVVEEGEVLCYSICWVAYLGGKGVLRGLLLLLLLYRW